MTLQGVQKTKDFLICVDSDGCATDTMDVRHFQCFGSCMVEEWGLGEWALYGLLEHVDVLLVQNVGSKAFCIAELLKKGYDRDKVLMTGDAPGDLDAAKENGVFCDPILVRHEGASWQEFRKTAVDKLAGGSCGGAYQQEKLDAFLNNLKA